PFFAPKWALCDSFGLVRMPSAEPGTRMSPWRTGSSTTDGNSDTTTEAVPTASNSPSRTGTLQPGAASPGADTLAGTRPIAPRFTPPTWTVDVRPRWTASGNTPVITGTSPTCSR